MKLHIASDKTRAMFLAFASLLTLRSSAATTAGALEGTVIDDAGKPVAGAHVLISSVPFTDASHFAPPPIITGALAATATSDSHGAFSVATLPVGQYIACAEVIAPGLLDPCHWAASAPTFTVTAGNPTAGVNITMARGAVVPIHVDDPKGLLKSVTGPIDFDLQIHAVTSKGIHYNAAIQARGPLKRDHAITIPFDTSVSIRVLGSHLVVNDPSGQPVPPAGTNVKVPSGSLAATIDYVVAGKK
jgi:hypothetical protein